MLTFPSLKHHQTAYVTTDLDEALSRLDKAFGLSRFYIFDTVTQQSHPNQPKLKIALVRTAGTEFEIIQPLTPNEGVYSDPLPKDGSFALQFHHIAVTVPGTPDDFERYRASIDPKEHPFVVDGYAKSGEGEDLARWFYTDETATLGHYIEHCWFSDTVNDAMRQAVPYL
jgi:hypothetical protein